MVAFGAVGEAAVGELPDHLLKSLSDSMDHVALSTSSVIIPGERVHEGILIKSTSGLWLEIVRNLSANWSDAFEYPPEKWEEIIAGAFKRAGYDEVTLTPRSGDRGRDVIAIKHGIGCIKVIGSVKAFKAGSLVTYDSIRALIGVMSAELDVSKGIIATTSDFPPRVSSDPFIEPHIPTRLELMNGAKLKQWLTELAQDADVR